MRLVSLLVLMAAAIFPGCRATIPATDTEKPSVDLNVSGPGIRYHCGTTECSDTPDLLRGTGAYDTETIRFPEASLGDGLLTFVLTVSDRGGVKNAGLALVGVEKSDYEIVERPSGAEVQDIDAFHKTIFVYGDAADPRTLLGLTVKIRFLASARYLAVTGTGLDFGGASGRSNANDTRPTNFQIWHSR